MKKNMEEQMNRLLAEVAELLQSVGAATGMGALQWLIEALLITHKQLVAALPGKYRAELKQEMLNIIMIHVLSPCGDVQETLGRMRAFAAYHEEPCRAEVQVSENCEKGGEA